MPVLPSLRWSLRGATVAEVITLGTPTVMKALIVALQEAVACNNRTPTGGLCDTCRERAMTALSLAEGYDRG